MSFVLPAKYNEDAPEPVDQAVRIRRVPGKKVAVAVFSGFVTDGEVQRREKALRRALLKDPVVRVKPDAQPEVAQVTFYTLNSKTSFLFPYTSFVFSWHKKWRLRWRGLVHSPCNFFVSHSLSPILEEMGSSQFVESPT